MIARKKIGTAPITVTAVANSDLAVLQMQIPASEFLSITLSISGGAKRRPLMLLLDRRARERA
jgi:hypothetical protein